MAEPIKTTAEKIKKLQIQGARNVAIAAVKAIKTIPETSKAKTKTEFIRQLEEAQKILSSSRETEPLMRNALRYLIFQIAKSKTTNILELRKLLVSNSDQFLADLNASRETIAQIGAKRIRNNSVVFTHCHSSTVIRLLSKAKEEGKKFEVICTETRPAFQGRITASELTDMGIKTTFIVDSAARTFIENVDIVIVGADAIAHKNPFA